MTQVSSERRTVERLRASLGARAVVPGNPGYDDARAV